MSGTMRALVYEGPYSMTVREVPVPEPGPDEVLIRVAFSGICGSELSGYEGKNALRKPPLIMGHEFTGTLAALGADVAGAFPELAVGARVTANPLVSCGECEDCRAGRPQLCSRRKLLSASLPGSNAQYVVAPASALFPLPGAVSLPVGALTEPAACAVHAVRLAGVAGVRRALVAGAGPIGLLTVEALLDAGVETVYCMERNGERLAMAEAAGAVPATPGDPALTKAMDLAVDCVGNTATRQACLGAVRSAGTVVWIGLHEPVTPLDVNDMIRREVRTLGSFGYTPDDFRAALDALADGRLYLRDAWTRVEPLERGPACFEELLHGASVAKIWLQPPAG